MTQSKTWKIEMVLKDFSIHIPLAVYSKIKGFNSKIDSNTDLAGKEYSIVCTGKLTDNIKYLEEITPITKDLPYDILKKISFDLNYRDLTSLCSSNTQFSQICNIELFWRDRLLSPILRMKEEDNGLVLLH